MIEKTIKVNGANVTVRTETGRMALDYEVLVDTLLSAGPLAEDESVYASNFIRAVTQSKVDGDLGFEWVTAYSGRDAIMNAMECWLDLPAKHIRKWLDAITEVNRPPNDPDLLPPDQVPPND